MNIRSITLLSLVLVLSLASIARSTEARSRRVQKLYQQMSAEEQRAFVSEQSRRIARAMGASGSEFTPDFEAEIQRALNQYAQRVGNNGGERLWKGDARFIFERGQAAAPVLIRAFRARNVSPLIGLYLPFIESEYVNIQTPNASGALGMFQFLPKTGERYGLNAQELLDVEKSADAAARYITDALAQFKDDSMKEALALLSYNRGVQKTAQALQVSLNEQNRRCSICALTANRSKLDPTFQEENVYYVPRFFAAAVMGENPQAFGLQGGPLSSYETKH